MAHYLDRLAFGHGLATVTTPPAGSKREPQVLDVWYPFPVLGEPGQTRPPVGFEAPEVITEAERIDQARGVETMVIFTASALAQPPVDVADVYLRLHLIKDKMVEKSQVNLTGMLDILPTVVWTDVGPCPPEDIESTILRVRTIHGRSVRVEDVCQVRPGLDI